jgi:class 3 adenylate cyclase/tetratricopeptide (TPR) repeat protein
MTLERALQFIPAQLRDQVRAVDALPEHRHIAAAFVRFSGTDRLYRRQGAATVAEALHELIRGVQEACEAYGVAFLETDVAIDGGNVLLVAGAPRTYGDDEERLVSAVRSILDRTGSIPLRAGVNSGPVYVGEFGPSFRRTYSVKGDMVNVAARLSARARPDEMLAARHIADVVSPRFTVETRPPFAAKGKRDKIVAAAIGSAVTSYPQGDARAAAPLVGREAESRVLTDALHQLSSGEGGMIDLVGEAGIGKSSLVERLAAERQAAIALLLPNTGRSRHSSGSFAHLVRALLVDAFQTQPAHLIEAVTAVVDAELPHLRPSLPLLAQALGLPVPATPATVEIDERFRTSRLTDLVIELLVHRLPGPTMLVIDDVDGCDPTSIGLVQRIARETSDRAWLLITTRARADAVAPAVAALPRYRRVEIRRLDAERARNLLQLAFPDRHLPDHVERALIRRARGNPLFLLSLASVAHEPDDIEGLPSTLEKLLAVQIDRLPTRSRTLLRIAAVLGTEFSLVHLDEAASRAGYPALTQHLDELCEFVEVSGSGTVSFKHVLMRDAAYATVPYRLRRALHAHVGAAIEATRPDGGAEDVLCEHFFHAGDYRRAWSYARGAAAQARQRYSYAEAITFLKRAAEAGGRCGAPAPELADVVEALGDVLEIVGLSQRAIDAYRRCRRYVHDDRLVLARLVLKEAALHQRLGEFARAAAMLTYARRRLAPVPAHRAMHSRLAARIAFGHYLQGRHRVALRWSQTGVREARDAGDTDALAFAYNVRHLVCASAGVPEDIPYGALALQMYEATGDLRMQGHCLNNLAISDFQLGDWSSSLDRLRRAAVLFGRIGDTANEANARYNCADLLIRQGHFQDARQLLEQAHRGALLSGDRVLQHLIARESARAYLGLADLDRAEELLDDAAAALRESGMTADWIVAEVLRAQCRLLRGDADGALARVRTVKEFASSAGGAAAQAMVCRVEGAILLTQGAIAQARQTFDTGSRAADVDGGYEHALNLVGAARTRTHNESSHAPELKQAEEILDRLGVVQLPYPFCGA